MTAQEDASDAIGSLVRRLALRPDPADLHVLCPGSPARPGSGRRDAVVVRLDRCLRDLPVSAVLELALACGRTVSLHPHDDGPGARDAPARDVPRCEAPPCADRAAREVVAGVLADAAALLAAAGRTEQVGLGPVLGSARGSARTGRRARPWRARRPPPVLDADALPLPRRAVLLPVVGARRPGGRGRAATERTRLLAVLDVLGPAARAAALPGDRPAPSGAPSSAAPPAAAPSAAAPPPAVPPAAPSAGAPPAAVLAAADCDGCRVCVRGCPADALAVVATGTVVQLRHDVRACTDCGRCVELCPTGALTRTGSRPWQDLLSGTVVTLATVPVATCTRCRGTYATTARGPGGPAVAEAPGLCPVCRFRRAQPFGSSVPAPRRG